MHQTISRQLSFIRLIGVLIGALLFAGSVFAQTTTFTYKGQLTDAGMPASGSYAMQFKLFDALADGNQIGPTLRFEGDGTNPPVTVTNGVYSVQLDFGAEAFPGADRYLQVEVRYIGDATFTPLSPRRQFTSTPYAIRSLSAATADIATDAQRLGSTDANKYVQTADPRLSNERDPTADSLHYIWNTTSRQSASDFNISGDGTAGGTLSGNTVNAATQYNLGDQRVLLAAGDNLFVGLGAGRNAGVHNSFFGKDAGLTTTGNSNSFFGTSVGQSNSTGNANSLFGAGAGLANTSGNSNSFFGVTAGHSNTTGGNNSFFGWFSGSSNVLGTFNTLIGTSTDVGSDDLNYATAIGAGSIVRSSNTVVLGRSEDTVQIPGNLVVTGSFNTGGSMLSSPGTRNLFAGVGAGQSNTTGGSNSFFGHSAGLLNTQGFDNSFFGVAAGTHNTGGLQNSFFGRNAGAGNVTGSLNTFAGMRAGAMNSVGNNNSFFGVGAGGGTITGGGNSFVGLNAGYTNQWGENNTILGSQADLDGDNLDYATAIGANAVVGASDTIVLGKVAGTYFGVARPADTVLVPGDLSARTLNSETQYNVGSQRMLGAAGLKNLFVGVGAGNSNTGGGNSFVGAGAGQSNTTGGDNSVVGADAGVSNTTGQSNSFFGAGAGGSNTTGQSNSFFGRGAGVNNTVGRNITLVGSNADVGNDGLRHATAIGAGSIVSSNNTVVLGRSQDTVRVPGNFVGIGTFSVTTLGAAGSTNLCLNASKQLAKCSSSLRYKTNIATFSSGLNLVSRLRPISFDWKAGGPRDVGFGAEEVAAINPLFVSYNSNGQVEGVKYDRLSVAFVNAFKEQQTQIEQQRDQIRKQQNQIDVLRKLVCLDHPNTAACK